MDLSGESVTIHVGETKFTPPNIPRRHEFKSLPYDNGSPRIIFGMMGFGDSMYMRPILRHFRGSYLRTPFPWLFSDLGVNCVKPSTPLRTQAAAIESEEYRWYMPPQDLPYQTILYRREHMDKGGIPYGIADCMGITDKPLIWDAPPLGTPWNLPPKVALIRPVCLRTEYHNAARNCDPQYIAQAADILRRRGYSIITVADLQRGAEWALQPLPVADVQLYGGELAFSRLLALVQAVTVCVGTPGWIVPACLLTGTPLYCVAGGIGGHNGPDRIAPGFDHVGFALPDNYCMCYDERHDCPKHISDFEGKFNDWLTSKNL